MTAKLTILFAQINLKVGAITENLAKILAIIKENQSSHDLILFPELSLTGYPPEDLLFRTAMYGQIEQGLQAIAKVTSDCHIVIGHPVLENGQCYNAASIFYQGELQKCYRKQELPNEGVFDELRYFESGAAKPCLINIKGYRLGLCICEDIWQSAPIQQIITAGADALLCINASPFDYKKPQRRHQLLSEQAKKGLAIFYVNLIGGQDELIFDGQSLAYDKKGLLCARLPAFVESLQTITLCGDDIQGPVQPLLNTEAMIYQALVCATRDYVEKNGFPGVLLGLSGGIDSALTLAIAVDALGANRVHAVLMPSRYTANMSVDDAHQQLAAMKVASSTLSIEPAFNSMLNTLAPSFSGLPADTTEENLQARIRGMLLMALSNKTGNMVLTTSNKSETAVGYSTLYGDMAGGFAVLKDVLKTQVYQLAHYRNSISAIIPERVITRAPSAELAPNQTDQDSLPDYAILDSIIQHYMEENLDTKAIIQQGFLPEDVTRVIQLIKRNEYKRRQAAPGPKISPRAFGRDWRYPITSGYLSL